MRTGEWVVQLEYAEYLGSGKMRTGEWVVQLEYAEYLWSWKMSWSGLTDNSHSDFLRDEKCFRATRRLVSVFH